MSHAQEHEPGHGSSTRRDFIYYATAGAGAVTVGAAVWPLVNTMNPSADVQALASIRVDLSGVSEGTQLTVLFQGKPVFIRYRTPEEIEAANGVDVASLPDPLSQNANIDVSAPAVDANRALPPFGAEGDVNSPWLVMWGVCTHLGCVPLGEQGDFGGWFCPCHGSHYDTAGRVRSGPAPLNLPIPLVAFVDDTTIQLG